MKIVSILGARPQFIKEAIVQKEINRTDNIEEIVIHTGQHYDKNMSDIFFKTLNIPIPKYNLGIHSDTHGIMTGKMIIEIEKILINEKPNLVLLYGDTDSTLAGAIAASKLNIEIAHVEAGLRQEPKTLPEEINRSLVDRVSNFLFCPSELSVNNLSIENITKNVVLSGDVMYDLFLYMKDKFDYSIIEKLHLREKDYVIMTLHRDVNVDSKKTLEIILKQISFISNQLKVVFPIHPRTKKRITQFDLEKYLYNVIVIEPLDYLSLMGLTENCFKVITDSGGYQKEAYFCEKEACILMQDTAWRELIQYKWNKICDVSNFKETVLSNCSKKYISNLYGEGNASKLIVNYLIQHYVSI